MLSAYPACFFKEENGYSVIFPDLNYLATCGETSKELELDSVDGFINMVTVDVAEYAKTHFEKSVKKTLTIPAWLNQTALEHNINFSQVLQDALKAQLHLN